MTIEELENKSFGLSIDFNAVRMLNGLVELTAVSHWPGGLGPHRTRISRVIRVNSDNQNEILRAAKALASEELKGWADILRLDND